MIKKLFSLILAFILLFTVSSCKADNSDLVNQLDKMQELIDESENYNKDYKIEGNIKFISDTTSGYNYIFIKDEDNYYIEINIIENDTLDNKIKYRLIKENEKYIRYLENGKIKSSNTIELTEYKNDIESVFGEINISLSPFLKNVLINVKNTIEERTNNCNDNLFECKMDKDILGELTIDVLEKLDSGKIINCYVLKKGKLMSSSTEYKGKEYSSYSDIILSYDNQKIEFD